MARDLSPEQIAEALIGYPRTHDSRGVASWLAEVIGVADATDGTAACPDSSAEPLVFFGCCEYHHEPGSHFTWLRPLDLGRAVGAVLAKRAEVTRG